MASVVLFICEFPSGRLLVSSSTTEAFKIFYEVSRSLIAAKKNQFVTETKLQITADRAAATQQTKKPQRFLFVIKLNFKLKCYI